ncbi:MAG: DUF4190 domain-containing protein [Ilumatobacteraceae bacterium]
MSMPPPPPSDPFPHPPGSSFPPQPPGYQPYPASAPMPDKRTKSGMAIAGFVCSLVGVIPCFWAIQIMGLLGTIFGFIGLKQTKDGRRGGRGLAIAGVVIGIILLLVCAAIWIYIANSDCVRSGNSFVCTRN